MCPFPGAIGRFWMHGAEILPSRAAFRVEGPEIMHGAKMLPAPFRARGPANWPNWPCALRPGPDSLAACTGLCHLACPSATRARGPPPIAAIRTSAPHPNAVVTSRLHSSPPPFTSRPPCSPCHPSHRPSRSGVGCRSGVSRAHPPPAAPRPAAVPVIPAKWCGDTIAHTRKLRF